MAPARVRRREPVVAEGLFWLAEIHQALILVQLFGYHWPSYRTVMQ